MIGLLGQLLGSDDQEPDHKDMEAASRTGIMEMFAPAPAMDMAPEPQNTEVSPEIDAQDLENLPSPAPAPHM